MEPKALQSAFASEYAYLVKAQNFHWNVVGREFYADHLLFERLYTEVQENLDAFAENLRKTGTMVPAGLAQLAQLSIVNDSPDSPPSARVMVTSLCGDSEKLCDIYRDLVDAATAKGNHGLANFFAERQNAHAGHAWMLNSVLG
jgi:starvation-inducible DNA-binding protein